MSEQSPDKCPVCGWDNGETAREVQVDGRTVRVCCDDCAQALQAAPAQAAG
jgi:hypothetical protein